MFLTDGKALGVVSTGGLGLGMAVLGVLRGLGTYNGAATQGSGYGFDEIMLFMTYTERTRIAVETVRVTMLCGHGCWDSGVVFTLVEHRPLNP